MEYILDLFSVMARFKSQAYLTMSDEELLEVLDDYEPEFAADVYRIVGDK